MADMSRDELVTYLREVEGYLYVRDVGGVLVGVRQFIYTWGLCIDLDRTGYAYRYCYNLAVEAILAASTWDLTGDPPGLWIVEKGREEKRLGPGARHPKELADE